jgi:FkbM family methyltransferase
MHIGNIGKRIGYVWRYWSLADSYRDYFGLTALGIARGHSFTSETFMGRVGKSIYPSLNVRIKPLGGKRVAIDLGDPSHMVILDEFAFDHVYDVDLPFKPDMVFDCGGHIGLFSLLAASRYPGVPIVTFEPNPRNVIWLKRNIAANDANIELVEAAVSIADGTEWFDDAASHAGHLGSAPPTSSTAVSDKRYEVRVVDFSRFFKSRNTQRPLLKIDIEGEEMRLIPQLIDLLPAQCAVFVETHAGEQAWNSIGKLFTDLGFTVSLRSHWEYLNMGLSVRSPSAGEREND